jgi:5-methylcytosine-specific restriction endonuclease McrA
MPYKDTKRQKEYQRLWMLKRRNEYLQKNGPCTKCLSWIELELHHKNPKEKVTHRIWSWSKERREKELVKCEILCHGCHKKETLKFLRKNFEHGTQSMYHSRKCRCPECRAANASTRRKQRATLKLMAL